MSFSVPDVRCELTKQKEVVPMLNETPTAPLLPIKWFQKLFKDMWYSVTISRITLYMVAGSTLTHFELLSKDNKDNKDTRIRTIPN